MQDTSMESSTASASSAPATSDVVTTVARKRKHAFYVTPEGLAPATTPKWAPPVMPPDPRDIRKREQNRLARMGGLLFFGGIALAFVTCAISLEAGSKTVVIATGPMMAGVALMLRASR
jgi:hypothetical protein